MEEYMKKKRMIKAQRNDRDELEEFEKDFIEVDEIESSKGRYLILAVVLALFGLVYFGGIKKSTFRASQAFEDSPSPKDKRASDKQSSSKQANPSKGNTAPADDAGPNREESPDDDQLLDRDKAGGKKKGKKR